MVVSGSNIGQICTCVSESVLLLNRAHNAWIITLKTTIYSWIEHLNLGNSHLKLQSAM